MRRVGAYLKSAAVQLPQSHGVAAAAAAAAAASSLSWEASRPCPAVWFGSRGGWRWGSQPQDLLGASAVAAAALAALLSSSGTSDTCGIVGVVGKDNSAREVLLEGLQILRNRGYDSCGLATIDEENNLVLSKFASRGSSADSIDLLRANSSAHDKHSVGIAHTRWATHGGKTDRNAHPHMDYKNRIALVHNGTINNASELRAELEGKGVEFRSETDTEVIAHLVGWELDQDPKVSLKVAVSRALSHCDGTWGLAVMSKDCPSDIVAACQGSPLVIGIGTDRLYLASETSAFSRMTKNFIAMKDGEIATLNAESFVVDMGRVQEAHVETVAPTPAPHPHWTIKECLQQPEAIARALAYGSRFADEKVILGGLDRNKEKLQQVRNLLISACGTSLYASMYGARIMRELGAFDTAVAMDAAELALTDIPKHSGGLLVVSQSGETRDVMNSIKKGEVAGVPRLSVVNVVGSAIARETKLGVYMHAGREQAVASTKAFTGQVTVLSLLALWFRQLREEEGGVGINMPDKSNLLSALQRLPISFGMAMGVRSRCKEIAAALLDADHCFVLGKGYATPVALEGALKLKEMAYLHAEGYSGGALKHGPFALIEGAGSGKRATPIIMLILDDEHANHMRTAAQEVRARGAQVFVITDNPKLAEGIDNKPVVIPSNNELTALIGVLPLQLIAYELAVLKGIDPDTPRNLAKAVTTD